METIETPWRHQSGYVKTHDGVRLFWQGLEPRGGSRGAVAALHGCNSSSDYMLPMMSSLAEQGFSCYGVDYRGHGRSEGLAGHIFHFRDYLTDVEALCRHAAERSNGQGLFLFGNSLGGLVASLYGLMHPVYLRGVALTAPFFWPAFRIPFHLNLCARALSLLHPTMRVPRRRADQPEHITLRWWTETLTAQQVWRRQAEKFTLPVLILHGQEDAVACPAAAYSLFRRLGSRDKIFGIFPGARHDDLDPCWGPRWWNKVGAWLTRRVEDPSPVRSACRSA
jgi:alpha-beta hydrolase superfamily lysophospholipase